MKPRRTYIILILTLFSFQIIIAQTINDFEHIRPHGRIEKTAQLNDYISFMASKKKSVENRKYYKTKALNLFMGKGYDYEENGKLKEGVMMEITSVNKKSVSHQLMRDYFDSVICLKYTDVKITSTEIANIKISSLKPIDDSLYVCTCQYDQAFVGYRDGRPVYKDITTKRIKCYVYAEDTEDGTEYITLLGDVSALAVRRL